MWIFPLLAAVVSGLFSSRLWAAWAGRRRPHLLAWALALAMFALASASAFYGMLAGWSEPVYRLYYLLGAIVNVVVLGLGSIYLLAPRRVAQTCAVVVVGAVVVAAAAVFSAELRAAGLETAGLPRGSDVMPLGVRSLSRYYSITGFLVVLGGALYSAARLARSPQPHLRRLAIANLLIAAGTTVVAAASELARIATGSIEGSIFGIGLFAGVGLMFLGFTKTRARPTTP